MLVNVPGKGNVEFDIPDNLTQEELDALAPEINKYIANIPDTTEEEQVAPEPDVQTDAGFPEIETWEDYSAKVNFDKADLEQKKDLFDTWRGQTVQKLEPTGALATATGLDQLNGQFKTIEKAYGLNRPDRNVLEKYVFDWERTKQAAAFGYKNYKLSEATEALQKATDNGDREGALKAANDIKRLNEEISLLPAPAETPGDIFYSKSVLPNFTTAMTEQMAMLFPKLATQADVVAGQTAAGAGIGAGVGAVVGGVGAVPGAVTGAGYGFRAGVSTATGLSSYELEYSNTLLGLLSGAVQRDIRAKNEIRAKNGQPLLKDPTPGFDGIDINDPEQLAAAFSSPELMTMVKQAANEKGIPVGVVDGATAVLTFGLAKGFGMANKAAGLRGVSTATKTGQAAGLFGTEIIGGMGGEAISQKVAYGGITDPNAIYMEGALEVGGGLPVVGAALGANRADLVQERLRNYAPQTSLALAIRDFRNQTDLSQRIMGQNQALDALPFNYDRKSFDALNINASPDQQQQSFNRARNMVGLALSEAHKILGMKPGSPLNIDFSGAGPAFSFNPAKPNTITINPDLLNESLNTIDATNAQEKGGGKLGEKRRQAYIISALAEEMIHDIDLTQSRRDLYQQAVARKEVDPNTTSFEQWKREFGEKGAAEMTDKEKAETRRLYGKLPDGKELEGNALYSEFIRRLIQQKKLGVSTEETWKSRAGLKDKGSFVEKSLLTAKDYWQKAIRGLPGNSSVVREHLKAINGLLDEKQKTESALAKAAKTAPAVTKAEPAKAEETAAQTGETPTTPVPAPAQPEATQQGEAASTSTLAPTPAKSVKQKPAAGKKQKASGKQPKVNPSNLRRYQARGKYGSVRLVFPDEMSVDAYDAGRRRDGKDRKKDSATLAKYSKVSQELEAKGIIPKGKSPAALRGYRQFIRDSIVRAEEGSDVNIPSFEEWINSSEEFQKETTKQAVAEVVKDKEEDKEKVTPETKPEPTVQEAPKAKTSSVKAPTKVTGQTLVENIDRARKRLTELDNLEADSNEERAPENIRKERVALRKYVGQIAGELAKRDSRNAPRDEASDFPMPDFPQSIPADKKQNAAVDPVFSLEEDEESLGAAAPRRETPRGQEAARSQYFSSIDTTVANREVVNPRADEALGNLLADEEFVKETVKYLSGYIRNNPIFKIEYEKMGIRSPDEVAQEALVFLVTASRDPSFPVDGTRDEKKAAVFSTIKTKLNRLVDTEEMAEKLGRSPEEKAQNDSEMEKEAGEEMAKKQEAEAEAARNQEKDEEASQGVTKEEDAPENLPTISETERVASMDANTGTIRTARTSDWGDNLSRNIPDNIENQEVPEYTDAAFDENGEAVLSVDPEIMSRISAENVQRIGEVIRKILEDAPFTSYDKQMFAEIWNGNADVSFNPFSGQVTIKTLETERDRFTGLNVPSGIRKKRQRSRERIAKWMTETLRPRLLKEIGELRFAGLSPMMIRKMKLSRYRLSDLLGAAKVKQDKPTATDKLVLDLEKALARLPDWEPFWLGPAGEVIPVDSAVIRMAGMNDMDSHAGEMITWLKENKPEIFAELEQKYGYNVGKNINKEMINRGWLRTTNDGNNILIEGKPGKEQVDLLTQKAISMELGLVHDKWPSKSKVLFKPGQEQIVPPIDLLGAARVLPGLVESYPMALKTANALRGLDNRVANQSNTIIKGLTADKNNTVPYNSFIAKLSKAVTKQEMDWVVPMIEQLVENDRLPVDKALKVTDALSKQIVQVNTLNDPDVDKGETIFGSVSEDIEDIVTLVRTTTMTTADTTWKSPMYEKVVYPAMMKAAFLNGSFIANVQARPFFLGSFADIPAQDKENMLMGRYPNVSVTPEFFPSFQKARLPVTKEGKLEILKDFDAFAKTVAEEARNIFDSATTRAQKTKMRELQDLFFVKLGEEKEAERNQNVRVPTSEAKDFFFSVTYRQSKYAKQYLKQMQKLYKETPNNPFENSPKNDEGAQEKRMAYDYGKIFITYFNALEDAYYNLSDNIYVDEKEAATNEYDMAAIQIANWFNSHKYAYNVGDGTLNDKLIGDDSSSGGKSDPRASAKYKPINPRGRVEDDTREILINAPIYNKPNIPTLTTPQGELHYGKDFAKDLIAFGRMFTVLDNQTGKPGTMVFEVQSDLKFNEKKQPTILSNQGAYSFSKFLKPVAESFLSWRKENQTSMESGEATPVSVQINPDMMEIVAKVVNRFSDIILNKYPGKSDFRQEALELKIVPTSSAQKINYADKYFKNLENEMEFESEKGVELKRKKIEKLKEIVYGTNVNPTKAKDKLNRVIFGDRESDIIKKIRRDKNNFEITALPGSYVKEATGEIVFAKTEDGNYLFFQSQGGIAFSFDRANLSNIAIGIAQIQNNPKDNFVLERRNKGSELGTFDRAMLDVLGDPETYNKLTSGRENLKKPKQISITPSVNAELGLETQSLELPNLLKIDQYSASGMYYPKTPQEFKDYLSLFAELETRNQKDVGTLAPTLAQSFETLVLKNAIIDALNKNHEFLVIADDATVAMIEGHSDINDGMWAHYRPGFLFTEEGKTTRFNAGSAHNAAVKLTGDLGTEFNAGPSKEVKYADPSLALPPAWQGIRQPKPYVTGIRYSLEKFKDYANRSSLTNILGAAQVNPEPSTQFMKSVAGFNFPLRRMKDFQKYAFARKLESPQYWQQPGRSLRNVISDFSAFENNVEVLDFWNNLLNNYSDNESMDKAIVRLLNASSFDAEKKLAATASLFKVPMLKTLSGESFIMAPFAGWNTGMINKNNSIQYVSLSEIVPDEAFAAANRLDAYQFASGKLPNVPKAGTAERVAFDDNLQTLSKAETMSPEQLRDAASALQTYIPSEDLVKYLVNQKRLSPQRAKDIVHGNVFHAARVLPIDESELDLVSIGAVPFNAENPASGMLTTKAAFIEGTDIVDLAEMELFSEKELKKYFDNWVKMQVMDDGRVMATSRKEPSSEQLTALTKVLFHKKVPVFLNGKPLDYRTAIKQQAFVDGYANKVAKALIENDLVMDEAGNIKSSVEISPDFRQKMYDTFKQIKDLPNSSEAYEYTVKQVVNLIQESNDKSITFNGSGEISETFFEAMMNLRSAFEGQRIPMWVALLNDQVLPNIPQKAKDFLLNSLPYFMPSNPSSEAYNLVTMTKEFKDWFKKSKIKSATGDPAPMWYIPDSDHRIPNTLSQSGGARVYSVDQLQSNETQNDQEKPYEGVATPVFVRAANPLRILADSPISLALDTNVLIEKSLIDQFAKEIAAQTDRPVSEVATIIKNNLSALEEKSLSQLANPRGFTNTFVQGALKKFGFDSIEIVGEEKTKPDYTYDSRVIVFDPNQLKLANGFNTEFSQASPDILGAAKVTGFAYQPTDVMRSDISKVPFLPRLAKELLGKNNTILDKVMSLRRFFQDRFIDLKKIQQAIEEQTGEVLPDTLNAYQLEELYHGKVGARLTDFNENVVEPILKLLRDSGIQLSEIEEFMYALHAKERNERIRAINPIPDEPYNPGPEATPEEKANYERAKKNKAYIEELHEKGSGMSDNEADEIIEKYKMDERAEQFEQARQALRTMIDNSLRQRLEDGLITQALYNALTERYQNYVPLKGINGATAEEVQKSGQSTGRGFNVRGEEVKPTLGRISRAENILAYATNSAAAGIVRAEKNRIGNALYELVQTYPDPELWEIAEPETIRRLVTRKNPDTGEIVQTARNFVDPTWMNQDDIFATKINGETKFIRIKNKDLVRNLKNGGVNPDHWSGKVLGGLATFMRFLSLTRTGLNPEFIFTNPIRDLQTAAGNLSEEQYKDLAGRVVRSVLSLKPLQTSIAEEFNPGSTMDEWGESYRAFVASGGKLIGWMTGDIETQIKDIKFAVDEKPQKYKEYLKAVGDWIEKANGGMENGTRLAVFHHARQMGATDQQAAAIARNATVNFTKKGEAGPVFNSLFLFFNASLQGSARLLQAVLTSPKVAKLVGAIATSGLAASLFNEALGGDDEDGESWWSKVPEFKKRTNLIIMIPNSGGKYVSLPLPYGYNVFWHSGNIASDFSLGKKTANQTAARFAESVLESFNPIGGARNLLAALSPTIVQPFVEAGLNQDWAGRPIVPSDFPGDPSPTPPSERYFSGVSPITKDFTRFLNEATGGNEVRAGAVSVSPEYIDYGVSYIFGAVGSTAMRLLNLPFKAFDPNEELGLNDFPLLRRFVGEQPNYADYERFATIREAVYTAKEEQKLFTESGNEKKRAEAEKKYAPELAIYPEVRAATGQMQKLKKRIEALRDESDETGVDRSKEIKEIKEEKRKVIIRISKAYREALEKSKN